MQARDLLDETGRRQYEYPAVPEIIAVIEVSLRLREVGLFDEGIDLEAAKVVAIERRALADIAITGVRLVRLDGEQHEMPLGRDFGGAADGSVKVFWSLIT